MIRIIVAACLFSAVIWEAGCAASSRALKDNSVELSVSAAGGITLDGKPVVLAKLPRLLKSMGARLDTRILIRAEDGAQNAAISTRQALVAARLPNVLIMQKKAPRVIIEERPRPR